MNYTIFHEKVIYLIALGLSSAEAYKLVNKFGKDE
jgi:uncharacterized protein YoaH (UPF0181 family)